MNKAIQHFWRPLTQGSTWTPHTCIPTRVHTVSLKSIWHLSDTGDIFQKHMPFLAREVLQMSSEWMQKVEPLDLHSFPDFSVSLEQQTIFTGHLGVVLKPHFQVMNKVARGRPWFKSSVVFVHWQKVHWSITTEVQKSNCNFIQLTLL